MSTLFELGMFMVNEHYNNWNPVTDENIDEEMKAFQDEFCDQTINTVKIMEC